MLTKKEWNPGFLSFDDKSNPGDHVEKTPLADMDKLQRKKILQLTHAGFEVKCNRCGSIDVGVDSTIGYSERSVSVDLKCARCQYKTVIFS